MSHDPRAPGANGRAERAGERPEYTVYRAGRGARRGGGLDALRRLRPPRRAPGEPRPRRRVRPWRVVRWLVVAVLAWLLVSAIAFMVSAALQEGVSDATEAAVDGGSVLGGSTILVLGSDQRPAGSREPGASTTSGRADSILLLHVSLGSVRRLSILRDSLADIPGAGAQKINASYAIGGAPLAIRTVEGFLGNGVRIDHVIEVSFEDFPDFVDALGGITVEIDRCISSEFSGRRFRLRRGEHHLSGRQALAFARVRRNRCSPNEDDRARARRQQQVLSAIRARALSPATFVRLPLVAWEAPRTIRTDLEGPGLAALFTALMTGGSGKTRVLRPSGFGPGGTLVVPPEERRRAVRALLGR